MATKKEPKDVELYSDMTYCPHCGAIQNKKENFCSHCGKSLHKKEAEMEKKENVDPAKKENKTPWYKKKTIWLFVGLFVIALLTVGGVLYLKFNENNQFKTQVKGIWEEVKSDAESLNSQVAEMEIMEDFEPIALDVKNSEDIALGKKDELKDLDTPGDYQDGKKDLISGLEAYQDYLELLRAAADNPSDMTNQDISDIESSAEETKTLFARSATKLSFIDTNLPDDSYVIVNKFQEVRESYESELEAEEQAKAEAERESKEATENEAKAEAAVTSFMNAFIAGNEAELKKYMTSAFQKEFNYADLSADARMYSYPESFRITETEMKSETQYDITGRELDVNRDSGSKWTINRHFAVLYAKSEGKWLIDRWDIP